MDSVICLNCTLTFGVSVLVLSELKNHKKIKQEINHKMMNSIYHEGGMNKVSRDCLGCSWARSVVGTSTKQGHL